MGGNFFDSASAIMTLLSFLVFVGILWWTFVYKRASDFDSAAQLPFADEAPRTEKNSLEKRHG